MPKSSSHVVSLSDIEKEDSTLIGEKAAKLGDLFRSGFPMPDGFIITPTAYIQFLKQNNLTTKIKHLLSTVDHTRPESLLDVSLHIKKYIIQAPLSGSVVSDIFQAYKHIGGVMHNSTVTIDGEEVSGESNVILKIKEKWAALFAPKMILARQEKNENHFKAGATVIIQRLPYPEVTGTITTMHVMNNDKTKMILEVTNGSALISKNDVLIIKKNGTLPISDKQILSLANLAKKLEHHLFFPHRINWVIEKGKIYLSKSSPVTPFENKNTIDLSASSPKLSQPLAKNLQTATKLYITLDKNEHLEKISNMNFDGAFVLGNTEHLETICKALSPRPVIYCASDLPTHKLRESNPLLGYHGAFRILHDEERFKHELDTIKNIRNKHFLKNIWLMIPYVRNPRELIELKRIISASGLYRSPTFKLWMSIDIPANIVLIENFVTIGIDGISIGTDTLTSLMLGTDIHNDEVASQIDKNNPAMLWAYKTIIQAAHKHKIATSVIGRALSSNSSLIEKFVELGITNITVTPDSFDQTKETIIHTERRLIK